MSLYLVEVTENDGETLNLDNISLQYTSIIYYKDTTPDGQIEWKEYQRLDSTEDRIWVNHDAISDNLKNAFVAIEDQDFYTHNGVNWKRTIYAVLNEVSMMLTGSYLRGDMQGASTLHQQLIKNITLDTEQDYMRKIREIFRALEMDSSYSKDIILEAYLNTIDLTGKIGGVEAGANNYFNKHAGDNENVAAGKEPLTLAECASIAAITKNPTGYSPISNPEQHLERRNLILYNMWQQGYIETEVEYKAAVAEPLHLAEAIKDKTEATQSNNSYFTDKLINDVLDDLVEQKGMTRAEASEYLYNGGLRIYSTVVPELQTEMENMFSKREYWPEYPIEEWQPTDSTGKLILNADGTEPEPKTITTQASGAVVNYTGELCAVVGGLGQKTADRTLNRATDSLRQVGSTIKGVTVYPLAIEYNFAWYSSTQTDSPIDDIKQNAEGKITGGWPRNYSGTYTNGPVTVFQAVRQSLNTIAVKYGDYVGVRDMYSFLADTLEVDSIDPVNDVALAPLALGSMTYGMTAYDLAGAYMMNGSGGQFTSLHSYVSVETYEGDVVLEPDINVVQAISEESAYIMNRLLANVMYAGGTASGLGASEAGMESVGKTGTSTDGNGDTKDVWFVGLTPYYVTSMWWGYDESAPINKYNPAYQKHPGALAWRDLMNTIQADEETHPYKEFPSPEENSIAVRRFCTQSGALAGANCPSAIGYYKATEVASELGVCPYH